MPETSDPALEVQADDGIGTQTETVPTRDVLWVRALLGSGLAIPGVLWISSPKHPRWKMYLPRH